jgi:hypothetical protein
MSNKYRGLAIGLAALVASVGAAIGAGNWETLPIVGQPATCVSTVSGAGGFNPQGNVGGGGATGQGQASSGSLCAQTLPAGPPVLTGSEIIPADTGQQIPATATIPVSLLGNFSGTPRNYLDNGSLNVQQRGTGIVTCGTTTVPSSAYGPDRWGCYANVASGAGRTSIVTTAALLPTGFASVNEVYRTSGALTQPICSIQEVPTAKATALQGKTVTLSFYAEALAGLSADNQNLITASIFTGTGSDQGLQTMTASPAITPAWTGIASPVNQQVIPITTAPLRYSVTGVIPAAATEVAVAVCFTPTATGAGVTDGFAYTGVQLEVAPSPSPYEFHDIQQDTAVAQRYYWQFAETVSSTTLVPGVCEAQSTTVAVCNIPLKVTMRAAPTVACTFGTLKRQVAGTDTALTACAASATTNGIATPDTIAVTATVASGDTAGFASNLMSGNSTGGGLITATADF